MTCLTHRKWKMFFFRHSKTNAEILSPLVKNWSETKENWAMVIYNEHKWAIWSYYTCYMLILHHKWWHVFTYKHNKTKYDISSSVFSISLMLPHCGGQTEETWMIKHSMNNEWSKPLLLHSKLRGPGLTALNGKSPAGTWAEVVRKVVDKCLSFIGK